MQGFGIGFTPFASILKQLVYESQGLAGSQGVQVVGMRAVTDELHSR
jgi:hypothetical protein